MPAHQQSELIDARETSRFPIYVHENWRLQVTARHFSGSFSVIDVSPFGLGAVIDLSEGRLLLENGEPLHLVLERPGNRLELFGIAVNIRPTQLQGRTWTRLGIMLGQEMSEEERRLTMDSRNSHRYQLRSVATITCSCEDPVYFGQKAFFKVEDVSIGGFCLRTSARNKFPFVNSLLPMMVTIPGLGAFPAELKVRHIRPVDDGRHYLLGGQWQSPSKALLSAIGDYCLAFAPQVTLRELREAGFPLRLASLAISIRSTASEMDFRTITRLRLTAYQSQGRLHHIRDPKALIDRFDEHARQLVAKIGDRIVAATRVVFNNGHRDRSEYQGLVNLPDHLWREGFIEISKICIDPDFRGGALFLRLGSEAFRTAQREGVRFAVAACLTELLPVYKRLGFRELDLRYHHRDLDETVHVIAGDIEAILKGQNIHFLYWCLLGAPLCEQRWPAGQRSLGLRLKLKLASCLRGPLLRFLENRRQGSPKPQSRRL